jgi:hypothetical protein
MVQRYLQVQAAGPNQGLYVRPCGTGVNILNTGIVTVTA